MDLRTVINATSDAWLSIAAVKRQKMQIPDMPFPLTVEGDADRLAQVLTNVVTNASKFTPEGGSIDIRTHVEDRSVRIEIEDSGIGIDPLMLESIFHLYSQEFSNFNRTSGLGIGLALARRILELHDGTITAHSSGRGLGARFEITLPRH